MNKLLLTTFAMLLIGIGSISAQNQNIELRNKIIPSSEIMEPSDFIKSLPSEKHYLGHAYYILRVNKFLDDQERKDLAAKGIEVLHYQPNMAYVCKVRTTISQTDLSQAGISGAVALDNAYKLSTRLYNQNFPVSRIAVMAWKDMSPEVMINELVKAGFQPKTNPFNWGEIFVELSSTGIHRLTSLAWVRHLDYAQEEPVKDGWRGRNNQRTNYLSINPGTGWDGSGVTMGIGDNDPPITHPDMKNRITNHDTQGSGTHGSMTVGCSSGSGNIDPYGMGAAPGTYMNYYFITYEHVNDAVANYTNLGTSITSTSFSQGCGGNYESTARNLDQDVNTQPNLVHFFSAGNSSSSNCNDYSYTTAPDGRRYGNITGGRKAAKHSFATCNLSSDLGRSASSSRGPADDGRLKPDISAQGNGQISMRPPDIYAGAGGTSAASPTAAGSAAVLAQIYKSANGGANPPLELLKPVMLNSADDIGNVGPDYDHGWGRANVRRAKEILDNNRYLSSSVPNQVVNVHNISVPSNVAEVKFMVYWLDPEGSTTAAQALVNNLDLTVARNGVTYHPWKLSTFVNIDSTIAPAVKGVDVVNNMEQVSIVNPAAGTYAVRVNGMSVPLGPQSYHVVYSFIYDNIVVTFPALNQRLVPGETERISWDAYDNNGTFTVQYSSNNGASYSTIASNVSGASRSYDWLVPGTAVDDARIRVIRSGSTTGTSGSFNILGEPTNFNIADTGPNDMTFSWNAVSGANQYRVWAIGNEYMEIIGTTSSTSINIGGFTDGEVNYYSVSARNTNGTEGRRIYAQKHTFVAQAAAAECNTCPTTISSYPYLESYEGTAPGWCQYTQDDINWTKDANGTTSSQTGPTNAADGTYYMYTESSGNGSGFPGKVAEYASPCFNLQGTSNPELSFSYHMYGSTMGSLALYASYDGGNNYQSSPLWSMSGNQGNVWNSVTLSLSAFTGQVDAKFKFVGTTGTSYRSDMAIDKFMIEDPVASNCVSTITSYPYNESFETGIGAWSQVAGDDINWTRDSGGTTSSQTGPTTGCDGSWYMYTESSGSGSGYPNKVGLFDSPCFNLIGVTNPTFDFCYSMYGSTMGTLELLVSTNGGLNYNSTPIWSQSGNQGSAWLNASVNISSYVSAETKFRFVGTTGTSYRSDMAIDKVFVGTSTGGGGCLTNTPLVESFESGFTHWQNVSTDDIDWTVDANGTPSSQTGPSNACDGTNYAYVETSGSANWNGKVAIIESPCFDFTGKTNVRLRYCRHMYGSTMGTLYSEYSTNGGTTWNLAYSVSGNQGNQWTTLTTSFSSNIQTDNVIFRFRYTTGTSWSGDVALDKIEILSGGDSDFLEPGQLTFEEPVGNISLAPNPARDFATLNFTSIIQSEGQIQLMDQLGKVVFSDVLEVLHGENERTINTAELSAGMYFVVIQADGYHATRKLIIAK